MSASSPAARARKPRVSASRGALSLLRLPQEEARHIVADKGILKADPLN
jgi:hypothetical protein